MGWRGRLMSLEVSGILKKIAKALEMGDGEIALNRFLYAYLGLKGAGPGRVSEADAKSGKIGVSEETWCMLQGWLVGTAARTVWPRGRKMERLFKGEVSESG
jgi:hypothetical protein